MTPDPKYVALADAYCKILNILAERSPKMPTMLRGVDFYDTETVKKVMAISLQSFVGGNKFLPSLQSPRTFNEKIFASKFLTPYPIPTLADKLRTNQVAAELFGEEYVADILWSVEKGETLEQTLPSVPEGTYFLKANHASGTNLRLHFDSSDRTPQIRNAKARANEWLAFRFGHDWGEWQYATFPKRVFLERALGKSDAADYRFYCFNSNPKIVQVDQNSYSQADHRRDFFDLDWKLLPILQGFPMSVSPPKRPSEFDRMVTMAEILAARSGVPFVRVDFFWSEEFGVKVAEVTYMPTNGTRLFSPDIWNYQIGDFWDLNGVVNV